MSQFVKELRKKSGLTQEVVSELLGVSRPTYSQIESGEREMTISEAGKLAGIFEMEISDLMEGKKSEEIKVSFANTKKAKKGKRDGEERKNIPQIKVEPERVEKFKQVILYILNKVGGKPNVGETVLYKLLYFIDFDYYEKYEEQLIGATYIKNHYGPTPIESRKILNEMINKNEIILIKKFPKYEVKKKYLAVNEPNMNLLTARELKHIDETLNRFSNRNAKWLTDYSHIDVPWVTAEKGKPIEYESVFYRTPETSVRNYEDDE